MEVLDAGDGKKSDPAKAIGHTVEDEKEFYGINISRLHPRGYGIQIGTYQELVNLMRLAENLKNSYKKDVTVQVKVLNGVKLYGLIVGNFSSRHKAEHFKAQLRKKFPDAFIVEFNRL